MFFTFGAPCWLGLVFLTANVPTPGGSCRLDPIGKAEVVNGEAVFCRERAGR
jgi:hypothetical protein